MSPFYSGLTDEQVDLIESAKIFFVGSADPDLAPGPKGEGPVNLSPKGGVPLHVIARDRVAYLDYPGSGNETLRHSESGGPTTIMVCSFDGDPAIMRLYGRARATPLEESPLCERMLAAPAEDMKPPRQVVELQIENTQTSCGYGVPVMEFAHHRSKGERGRRFK
jgi:hypothetical protein